jgi:hypothetical protein
VADLNQKIIYKQMELNKINEQIKINKEKNPKLNI